MKQALDVVSHSNSTSNHNWPQPTAFPARVVSHSNSTSNHNVQAGISKVKSLFLIPILHQTTTYGTWKVREGEVVSHSNSTSNHNDDETRGRQRVVVSHSNSTSNHNLAHGSNSYSARYTYDTDA